MLGFPLAIQNGLSDSLLGISSVLRDHYRVLREIGGRGLTTAYAAEDLRRGRQVLINVLRPDFSAALSAERLVREIALAEQLHHPNILPLYDVGDIRGLVYYVSPMLDGESLRGRLQREGQLPIEDAIQITKAVASALDHAHHVGIVHWDIKPDNILLHKGRPLVANFGIARAVSAAAVGRVTQTGLSLGTPHYMSPEQAMGESADPRSDIYSLAVVLYEMLIGEPPHTGGTTQTIIASLLTDQPTPLHQLRDAVPPAIDAAVRKGLAKLPADRFATAAEFADALTVVPSSNWSEVVSRKARTTPLVLATALVAAAAFLALVPTAYDAVRRARFAHRQQRIVVLIRASDSLSGSQVAFANTMAHRISDGLDSLRRVTTVVVSSDTAYQVEPWARGSNAAFVLSGRVRRSPRDSTMFVLEAGLFRTADSNAIWLEVFDDLATIPNSMRDRVHTALRGVQTRSPLIDSLIRGLPATEIAFNTPDTMMLGTHQQVILLMGPSATAEALREEVDTRLRRAGARAPQPIQSASVQFANRMEAHLTGSAFTVQQMSPRRQAVSRSVPTEWRWDVTPTRGGQQQLNLSLNAVVLFEGSDTEFLWRSFDATIVIQVSLGQAIAGFVRDNFHWLALLIAGLLIPLILKLISWLTGRTRPRSRAGFKTPGDTAQN